MNTDKIEIIWQAICKTLLYFQSNWLALAAFILSLISLVITLRQNIKNRKYADDKELVEQLKQSLELAFKSLSTNENGQPTNIRLRWLTAARHIARYRELQLSLKTKLYMTICEEHEEYWRDKIYNLLAHINDSSFFKCIDPEEMEEEEIDMMSAAIVYSFSVWKEGRPDPIDNMSLEEIIHKHKLLLTPFKVHRPFLDYVEKKSPGLLKKVKGHNS
jgi:HD-GYP domain-containing protein (c-di-GMP phosphodiesterase class II)